METSGIITIEDRIKQIGNHIDVLNSNMLEIKLMQKEIPFFSPTYQDLEYRFIELNKECERLLSIIRSLYKYGNLKDTLITYTLNTQTHGNTNRNSKRTKSAKKSI